MKRVEAIRQRISNLANPYPWVYVEKHTHADPDAHVRDSRDPEEDDGGEIVTDWCVNLKFIASAPADLTYLLDRLERAEKLLLDAFRELTLEPDCEHTVNAIRQFFLSEEA